MANSKKAIFKMARLATKKKKLTINKLYRYAFCQSMTQLYEG